MPPRASVGQGRRSSHTTMPSDSSGASAARASAAVEASVGALALAARAPLLSLGIVVWLLRRPWPTLALGGIASLFGIALAPAISAEAVAVPLVLLGLAAMEPGDGPSGCERKDRQASAP